MKIQNKIALVLLAAAIVALTVLWADKAAGGTEAPKKQNPCVKVAQGHGGYLGQFDCSNPTDRKKWAEYELSLKNVKAVITHKIIVTGYSSRSEETDDSPCISADGSNICELYAKGELICATNDFPMHSTLAIEGIGTCIIRDRMNRRYTGTNRVDWYYGFDTTSAVRHGVKLAYATIKTN